MTERLERERELWRESGASKEIESKREIYKMKDAER